MSSIRKVSILIIAMVFFSSAALAQSGGRSENNTVGARRQLATIIFAGLSGAILGLSTLSFYSRPQDRLSNIAVGFALGIFSGTVYTTYQAAAKPQDFYGLNIESELKNNGDEKELLLSTQIQIVPVLYQINF